MSKNIGFQKGNPGGPGRPKGVKMLDARKLKATVAAQVADKLEAMLKKAEHVIEERLDEGDAQVAMWLMDKLSKRGGGMLPNAIDIKLSTIDDVLQAAQIVTEMVLVRKLSIDEGQKALTMLSSYSAFRAFERIDELKALVEDMQRQNEARTINSEATMPSWGRLGADSPVANTKPAE